MLFGFSRRSIIQGGARAGSLTTQAQLFATALFFAISPRRSHRNLDLRPASVKR